MEMIILDRTNKFNWLNEWRILVNNFNKIYHVGGIFRFKLVHVPDNLFYTSFLGKI